MKTLITILKIMVLLPFLFIFSSRTVNAQGGGGGGDTAGNNLSFPVIWADGGSKVIPGSMGEYSLGGEWWYVWGEDPADPEGTIFSCKPNENDSSICENGSIPGDNGLSTVYKAYIQKDAQNIWQAGNITTAEGETVIVDYIDWGDNLESISWEINSMVRTEVVLYKDIDSITQFSMRHVDGWGINEVHGLQTTMNDEPIFDVGTKATVFTPNARFTIQKLNFTSESIIPSKLTWVAETGWTETNSEAGIDIVNEPIFNMAVSEADDGPGFYNAEINVKGKIIYGYTWNLDNMNEGEGHYRLTFSFDGNIEETTSFDDNTEIILPVEEDTAEGIIAEAPGSGGTAVLNIPNNLTYIDILIGAAGETLSTASSELGTFKIYPNPSTNGILNIKSTTGNLVNVYNALGQQVFSTEIESNINVQTLNLSALQPGLYFVQVSDNINTSVKKLILN